jgi:MFS family permease
MTTTNTLLQLAVPDRLRGRVMALHSALFLGVVPLGGVLAGRLADTLGNANVLAGCGVLLFVGALVYGRALVRRTRPADAAPEVPPPAYEPETPV